MAQRRHHPGHAAHLEALTEQLWTVLAAQVRRLQSVGLLAPPEQEAVGVTISPHEIEARLRLRRGHRVALPPLAPEDLEAIGRATARVRELTDGKRLDLTERPPFDRLVATFSLTEAERLVLLMAVGQEVDHEVSRLYGYLNDSYDRQYPTLSLVAELLSGPHERFSPADLMMADAPLVRWQLVRLEPMAPNVPTVHRPLKADERVIRFVRGEVGLDLHLAPYASLTSPNSPGIAPFYVTGRSREVWEQMVELMDNAELNGRLPSVVLRGPAGIGKRRFSIELATQLKRPLLIADLARIAVSGPSWGDLLARVVREARLHDAVLCLTGWESLLRRAPATMEAEGQTHVVHEERPEDAPSRTMRKVLASFDGALVILIEESSGPAPELGVPLPELTLPLPDRGMAEGFWHLHLPGYAREHALRSAALAEEFRLTPGQIAQASASAMRLAGRHLRDDARVTREHLVRAINQIVQHRLGETATLVERRHGWKDLIISSEAELELREVIERYRHKRRVLDEWNFGARFGHDIGLSVLFDGPPGTGKTMAAGVVAAELGLELYQIDLSRVVSKWIGETEKNLGRVFDEAERSRAVLLFDEADSLFAKRTSVQTSNDRYANLEVNYLLQRVERFTGIAILTTNFIDSIDSAFMRRIAMRVTFMAPDAHERKRLWKSMLESSQAPLDVIDFTALGRNYELAGGLIKNAVLRAAFLAAERGVRIDQELLEQCARIELKKAGHVVRTL